LVQTDLSLAEIAFAVGFFDQGPLGRVDTYRIHRTMAARVTTAW
jgi:hypothetical protein